MDTLFISDVHLSDDRPEKLTLFKELLRGPARNCRSLYILGDLFENFWLGNDDRTPPHPAVLAELKNFTTGGTPLYILRGNRDLMLDQGIETLTGARLLQDPTVINLEGKQVLIMHGDRLCTRDVSYQRFRSFMELRTVTWIFLRLPYPARSALVRTFSPAFKQAANRKAPEIMDVDPDAVIRTMREFKVDELIHGHTHRPGIHDLTVADRPAQRIVLGDWYDRELILVCRGPERKLMRVREYTKSME